jgi:hypothetical protein
MNDDKSNDRSSTSYDFSQGIRGKYVARLGGPGASWVREMALRDAQRWVAEGLLRFQQLEGFFVAYFVLVHDRALREAGQAASEAIGNPRSSAFAALLRDLQDYSEAPHLATQLSDVIAQRNWFVHRSFHAWRYSNDPAAFADRVSKVATALAETDHEFYHYLMTRCEATGFTVREAEAKADQVIQEWAAA